MLAAGAELKMAALMNTSGGHASSRDHTAASTALTHQHPRQGLLLLCQHELQHQPPHSQSRQFVDSEPQTPRVAYSQAQATVVPTQASCTATGAAAVLSQPAPRSILLTSSSPRSPSATSHVADGSPSHASAVSPISSSEHNRPNDQVDDYEHTSVDGSSRSPAKRPRLQGTQWPSGDSEAATASTGIVCHGQAEGERGATGGQPAGDGGNTAKDGSGGGGVSGGSSTPPTAGEQTRPSRVHSGDMVLHPHAIKA